VADPEFNGSWKEAGGGALVGTIIGNKLTWPKDSKTIKVEIAGDEIQFRHWTGKKHKGRIVNHHITWSDGDVWVRSGHEKDLVYKRKQGEGDDDDDDMDEEQKAATALRAKVCVVSTLDLAGNDIGPEGAQAVGSMLAENGTLKTLDLSYNSIGPQGVDAMAAAVQRNSSLTSLDLSYNHMGEEGVSILSRARERNAVIRSLELEGNNTQLGLDPSPQPYHPGPGPQMPMMHGQHNYPMEPELHDFSHYAQAKGKGKGYGDARDVAHRNCDTSGIFGEKSSRTRCCF